MIAAACCTLQYCCSFLQGDLYLPYLPQCTLSSKMEGLAAYFHQTDPMADAQQESHQM